MATPSLRFGFLRTRFARRTLLAFMGAALLPSLVATGLWFQRLRAALETEANAALLQSSKTATVALLERLDLLASRVNPRTRQLSLGGNQLVLEEHLSSPVPRIAFEFRDAGGARVRRAVDTLELWTALDQLIASEDAGYCVLATEPARILRCSPSIPQSLRDSLRRDTGPTGRNGRVFVSGKWRGAAREVFLRSLYNAPSWRIVSMQSDAGIQGRLQQDSRYLLFIGLLAVISAFALSHFQLRRQTAPIEVLQRATRAVREGKLNTRVSLTSGDEFAEFGETFNAMTTTLQQQFSLLGDFDALNQRALRAGNSPDLVRIALNRLGERSLSAVVGIVLIEGEGNDQLHYLTRLRGSSAEPAENTGQLTANTKQMLLRHDFHRVAPSALSHTTLLDPRVKAWRNPEVREIAVIPLRHERDLIGAVILGLTTERGTDVGGLEAERRLVERLALGLANSRLLTRLDALALGTLRAFGSTIDANSRWTAGHSERVTAIAEQLAIQLGVPERERLTLTRGCLLHDIGKVGVPASILDKAGRLTDEEFGIMQQHPAIGADILKTIPAFRELLPIVRWHHERIDGRGYPDKLRGDQIPPLVRITSVADVFDALHSARPYRDGLPLHEVQRIIVEGRGTQFDPRVVDALEVLLRERRLEIPSTSGAPIAPTDAVAPAPLAYAGTPSPVHSAALAPATVRLFTGAGPAISPDPLAPRPATPDAPMAVNIFPTFGS